MIFFKTYCVRGPVAPDVLVLSHFIKTPVLPRWRCSLDEILSVNSMRPVAHSKQELGLAPILILKPSVGGSAGSLALGVGSCFMTVCRPVQEEEAPSAWKGSGVGGVHGGFSGGVRLELRLGAAGT